MINRPKINKYITNKKGGRGIDNNGKKIFLSLRKEIKKLLVPISFQNRNTDNIKFNIDFEKIKFF